MRGGGLDLGIAFDGDGDRMLAVDERGESVDGDQILAVLALDLGVEGVAVTTMTNLGFHRLMEERGIASSSPTSATGTSSRRCGARGCCSAASSRATSSGSTATSRATAWWPGCSSVTRSTGATLSEAVAVMPRFPQVMRNLPRADGGAARRAAEGGRGGQRGARRHGPRSRRPSGTEPVVRVLTEAETAEAAERLCARIAALVTQKLG